MPKISLVEQMKNYAKGKYPNWVNVGDFERLALNGGYVASNARRRAQELRQKGVLEVRITDRAAEYRWKPQEDSSRNNNYRPEYQKSRLEIKTKLL